MTSQLLVKQTRALLQRRAPQYKQWLQQLVQIPSYTRDPADVRRQVTPGSSGLNRCNRHGESLLQLYPRVGSQLSSAF